MENKKNVGLAFILTFLLGPLGIFYSSSGCFTIVFFLISCVMLFFSFIPLYGVVFWPILVIIWVISMIWGVLAARN